MESYPLLQTKYPLMQAYTFPTKGHEGQWVEPLMSLSQHPTFGPYLVGG